MKSKKRIRDLDINTIYYIHAYGLIETLKINKKMRILWPPLILGVLFFKTTFYFIKGKHQDNGHWKMYRKNSYPYFLREWQYFFRIWVTKNKDGILTVTAKKQEPTQIPLVLTGVLSRKCSWSKETLYLRKVNKGHKSYWFSLWGYHRIRCLNSKHIPELPWVSH